MFKRIFARMKGILMLFVGSIALLAIALMLDFKTFEQFNFTKMSTFGVIRFSYCN